MAKKAPKFPPVLVVSGSQDLRRRRFLDHVVETQRAAGWTILEVDGADPEEVRDALDGDAFTPTATLAVVTSPEKMSLDVLTKHLAQKDYLTTLLLHIEGEPDGRTKFGKLVKSDLGEVHKNFPLPTEWKAPEVGVEFVLEEVQRLGHTIPKPLATALVDRVGTDLGVLAFEVEKITILAKLEGSSEVQPSQVARGMAPIAEASVLPITEALAARQERKLAKALAALQATSRDDQTMRVCRLLGTTVIKWMQATCMDAMPPKAAAEELGVHPWYYQEKILPAAGRWGRQGAIQLITDLACVERAVLSGALNPWVLLGTRLLSACRGTR